MERLEIAPMAHLDKELVRNWTKLPSIREEAEKVLTANLKGMPAFEVDDQSALICYFLWVKRIIVRWLHVSL